jgi:hypothetical protein
MITDTQQLLMDIEMLSHVARQGVVEQLRDLPRSGAVEADMTGKSTDDRFALLRNEGTRCSSVLIG